MTPRHEAELAARKEAEEAGHKLLNGHPSDPIHTPVLSPGNLTLCVETARYAPSASVWQKPAHLDLGLAALEGLSLFHAVTLLDPIGLFCIDRSHMRWTGRGKDGKLKTGSRGTWVTDHNPFWPERVHFTLDYPLGRPVQATLTGMPNTPRPFSSGYVLWAIGEAYRVIYSQWEHYGVSMHSRDELVIEEVQVQKVQRGNPDLWVRVIMGS